MIYDTNAFANIINISVETNIDPKVTYFDNRIHLCMLF